MAFIQTLLQLQEKRKKALVQTGFLKWCLAQLNDPHLRDRVENDIQKRNSTLDKVSELESKLRKEAREMGVQSEALATLLQALSNEDHARIQESLALLQEAGANGANHPAHPFYEELSREMQGRQPGSTLSTMRELANVMFQHEHNGDPEDHAHN